MTTHDLAKHRLATDYRYARTVERTASAPRWIRDRIRAGARRAALRRAARAAVLDLPRDSRPRLGLDSGRAGHWFLGFGCTGTGAWGWWAYAAAMRSLCTAGWTRAEARPIAIAASRNVRYATFSALTTAEPPTTDEADCYGWDLRDEHGAARSADEARRVRRWAAWWGHLTNDHALIGRRMRRWVAASVRAARAKSAAHHAAGWWPRLEGER